MRRKHFFLLVLSAIISAANPGVPPAAELRLLRRDRRHRLRRQTVVRAAAGPMRWRGSHGEMRFSPTILP